MSALTHVPGHLPDDQEPGPARTRWRLRGLTWMLARQHRTVLIVCAATTVLGAAAIIYGRGSMLDSLHAAGWPGKPADAVNSTLYSRIGNSLDTYGSNLSFLPTLFGVFLGAPLIAADHEQGTARLLTTQSVPRERWALAKVAFALSLAAVTAGTLGALFTWWWRSFASFAAGDWVQGSAFVATGPVLVAATLFSTAVGFTVGAAVRRLVPAMAVTFVLSSIAQVVAAEFRDRLATPHRIGYPFGGEFPHIDRMVQTDQWIGTASGKLYGYGTCVHDADPEACRADLGIVNSVVEYFSYDQMAGMQWIEAGVFLALAAALTGLALWWVRRSPM
ncbi:ABC transporter permease [Streptomyces sp. G-G2]|uniref:ABC transporter permease n=1 Tax=Streptomyces sp. G-G2 TaxID=3046201 RepID=UPI0024BAE689|nr:ABC transporter permease [Streptomyces sp. G-G2]MDJ0380074.1 ABC transporter permease [Streptomyces sp. G-G2]